MGIAFNRTNHRRKFAEQRLDYEAQLIPPEAEQEVDEIEDWWDYDPAEKRYVRVHEVPREGLFFLTEDEEAD